MKVLLVAVNAKYIHSNLAVYDLKAYTENIPVEVELAEYTINQQQEEILRDIYEHKADVVAFSCYIWNITYVKALAEELHKIAPQVQIWFGGPEASYDAKQLLRELSYVELVIVGEGEETFAQLLQKHLLDKERLENIVGICYRENTGESVTTVFVSTFRWIRSLLFITIWIVLHIRSCTMRQAGDAHFAAVTVCLLSTKEYGFAVCLWYFRSCSFS